MTAQTPEILLFRGVDLTLCSEPLAHLPMMNADRAEYIIPNTSLMRRYIGTWAVESDRLYLKRLQRWTKDAGGLAERGIESLFPGFPDGVFAHWYTGELRCPRGALLKYVHGGFLSIYEEDLFLRVQRGVLVEERIVRNGIALPSAPSGYQINAMTTNF